MKKRLFLMLAAVAFASMVSAQKTSIGASELGYPKKNKIERTDFKQIVPLKAGKTITLSSEEGIPVNSPAAPAALNANYYRPKGTLLGGITTNGGGYYPLFVGHGNVEWKFQNQSTDYTAIEWYIPTQADNFILNQDAQGNGLFTPGFIGNFEIPRVKVTSGATENTYYYGKADVESGEAPYALGVAGNELVLTPMDVYAAFYLGFTNGYGYGTTTRPDGSKIQSVGQFFERPQAPLFARSIGVFIFSENNTPLSGTAKLTGAIYKVKYSTGDNFRRLGDLVYRADVYAEDLIESWTYQSGQKVYFAQFTFEEQDEVTGLYTPVDLVLDDEFAFVVEGFDQTGVDCGIPFAPNLEAEGSAYVYLDNGYFSWYSRSQSDETNGFDVSVMIEGAYTTLIVNEATKRVIAPDDGGYAYFTYEETNYNDVTVESTYDSTEVRVDAPYWITVSVDNADYEENGVLYYFLSTEPLPEGVTGRAGNVVLASYGTTDTIYVKQGDAGWLSISAPQSAESAAAVRQGDNFLLTYPPSATSVSIYNVTGQQIGEYKLNQSGQQTLPAANWAKGIYILRFKGSDSAVKVLK
ncbi:MAG: T9SS type A sorting domain-containing protein [Dysgonamonadaceae bacterium]|jgi:hypothetical protein|nr:T9SS type A sorting domain-containing protein [Dysgonamonadaceae bacterium]